MSKKVWYYVLVVSGMGASLLISSFLLQNLFIDKTPVPYWDLASIRMSQLKQNIFIAQSSILSKITQNSNTTHLPQPEETPLAQVSFFDSFPAPTAPLAPTTPPVVETPIPSPYEEPTSLPIEPTSPLAPTKPPKPKLPTAKPTKRPAPTITPKPTPPKVDFPKVSGDPLKQTWYGIGSLECYTTERFIQVYAAGLSPNTCYNNIRAHMDANVVSTTLLGRTIQVHKKALAAFEAVSQTLDQYKVDSTTYKFPSKTYKIKNVGAYIFRCNVNASTTQDTCSTGCKLSPHAFGIGVDINYDENCNGCKNYDMPKEISDTFEIYGFRWGGHYPLLGSYIDPMHFEYMRDLCEGI